MSASPGAIYIPKAALPPHSNHHQVLRGEGFIPGFCFFLSVKSTLNKPLVDD